MFGLYEKIGGETSVPAIIIAIAIMLLTGFLVTRITKLLKLPNVTAYIIAGILIGPYCLNLVPKPIIAGTDFISDIALAFIAFSVGEYFKLSVLKRNGGKVVVITLFEALMASVAVFILTYFILRLDFAFSLILSALASATAPASTMMTIRQTGAHGDFVNTLLSVVALDDVVSLLAFSAAISISMATMGKGVSAGDVIIPILYNFLMIAIGVGLGFLLKLLMNRRSTDNRLIVTLALLFTICGVGAALNVSPLLACMAMGTVYINATDDEKLFKQINYFSPPILLLFFVRSGLNFRLDALFNSSSSMGGIPLIVIGILYFFVRILGKYVGAYTGCAIVKKPKETRRYLGLALTPQAGVALGLAALGARMLGSPTGELLETVIISSSILYELIGPAAAKLALYLSKSYGQNALDEAEAPPPPEQVDGVAELKDKIAEIQKEIAQREYSRSEEEAAFMDAAESEDSYSEYMRKKFINRR